MRFHQFPPRRSLPVLSPPRGAAATTVSRTDVGLGHIPALDGLRGLTVLAVMVGHALGYNSYFRGAFIGVDIFFVLSGFLITYLLVREYDWCGQRISLGKFYARRALRLGPALLVLLLVIVVGSWILFPQRRAEWATVDALITLFYAANWARAFQIHPPELLAHAWSLSIEEQFYVLWPIVLLLLLKKIRSRANIVRIILAGALSSWVLRVAMLLNDAPIDRLYNGLDTRADCLLVGCALGVLLASNLVSERTKPTIAARLRLLTPISAAVFLGALIFGDWRAPYTYYWLFAVVEALTALTIMQIFIAPGSAIKMLLSMRLLVWVGTISYGLYLWHYPVYRIFDEYGASYEQTLPYMRVIIATILTFTIAAISYYAMERPISRMKRRFTAAARVQLS